MSQERQRRRASEASVADEDDWIAPATYTVEQFCRAHHVSRSKLYQLWNSGTGPRKMQIGSKILISVEAAADWRREREAASAAEAV